MWVTCKYDKNHDKGTCMNEDGDRLLKGFGWGEGVRAGCSHLRKDPSCPPPKSIFPEREWCTPEPAVRGGRTRISTLSVFSKDLVEAQSSVRFLRHYLNLYFRPSRGSADYTCSLLRKWHFFFSLKETETHSRVFCFNSGSGTFPRSTECANSRMFLSRVFNSQACGFTCGIP